MRPPVPRHALPGPARVALCLALAGALLVAAAAAQRAGSPAYAVSSGLSARQARLGEAVTYRGRVVVPPDAAFQWIPPGTGADLTWGRLAARRTQGVSGKKLRGGNLGQRPPDTVHVETTVQAFTLGNLPVPGIAFRVRPVPGAAWRQGRLPMVRLAVVPVIPASDSTPNLRPVRGPLAAPWWERVPWVWVVLGLLLVAGLVAFVLWRRRRRRAAALPQPMPVAARDPVAEALAALRALHGEGLPEQGRFADHAFRLSAILRRFLEATEGTPRPGDTTPELVVHLEGGRLTAEDVERLAALLQAWDRVKFARAASSVAEARRAEDAVESLVRRRAGESMRAA